MNLVEVCGRRTTGVYCIENLFDGKRYVGSSSASILERPWKHLAELRRSKHGNFRLMRAWKFCGPNAFDISVLEFCPPEKCIEREQWWMDRLKPEYNINPTAGSPRGRKQRPESIEKTRRPHLGRRASPEAREKMRLAALGHKRCVGRVLSPETREKIRLGNLRRIMASTAGKKTHRGSERTDTIASPRNQSLRRDATKDARISPEIFS